METTLAQESVETVAEHDTNSQTSTADAEAATANKPSDPRKRLRRALLFGSLLVALAVIIGLAATRILSKPAAPPRTDNETSAATATNAVVIKAAQMSNIKVAAASLQPFRAEKLATGKIAFNEDVMTPVFSPFTGRVLRLLGKPGDTIKQGTPLFEIDTPDLVQAESDLINAAIALAKSNATLELARRAEDRQHRLYLNKAVALKDWEQAEADLKAAERDIHAAETARTAARARLRLFGKTDEEVARVEKERQLDRIARVQSPIAGTIMARKVGPGQLVKPDNPDPLFTVADLSTVWILADVYESDVPLLRVGQPVEVHVAAYPGESFTARIAYIAAAVDPATHRVAVRGLIENRGRRLKPGMFASLRIVTHAETPTLAVPLAAILHEGDRASVWVAQPDNRFIKREVTVGLEQEGYAQILSGLQPGEQVAVEGGLLLANAAASQE